ncbi:hypothetical protein L3X38_024042 [Prunus dulcis]|uniref:Uncharacterized protein n=1 Tax=Prunus dulcis TaxID=3755 RepID=A0AAD4Z5S7_PRUDU|nr:hypothetical protein L3X38_024042 [Prunus dulcis]
MAKGKWVKLLLEDAQVSSLDSLWCPHKIRARLPANSCKWAGFPANSHYSGLRLATAGQIFQPKQGQAAGSFPTCTTGLGFQPISKNGQGGLPDLHLANTGALS